MKRFYFLFALFLFLFPVKAQRFYITETQLQKLEIICQNYKDSNQKLQLQVNELQQQAEILKTDCKTLQVSLQTERATVQTLSKSLTEYENKNSQNEAEKIELLHQLDCEKLKVQKQKTTILIFIIVIFIMTITTSIYTYIKIKKSLRLG